MANPYEQPIDPFKEGQSDSLREVPTTSFDAHHGSPVVAQPVHATMTTPFAHPQAAYTSTEQPPKFAVPDGHPGSPVASFPQNAFSSGHPPFSPPQPPASPGLSGAAYQQQQQQQQQQGNQREPQTVSPTSKFWTIEFYQQFFDVDTHLVLMRMTNVLLPIDPPDFLADREWCNNATHEPRETGTAVSRKPDLYGPFWICTTLWMTLGIVSNIMSKIAFNHQSDTAGFKWQYDFTMASIACLVIYIYCFGFGTAVWGLMRFKGVPLSLVDTLCLYGYSMFIFLPVIILCMIPVSALQWIVVVVGGLWSTAFLLKNLWGLLMATLTGASFLGVISGIIFFHMLLTLSFKIYFLQYAI